MSDITRGCDVTHVTYMIAGLVLRLDAQIHHFVEVRIIRPILFGHVEGIYTCLTGQPRVKEALTQEHMAQDPTSIELQKIMTRVAWNWKLFAWKSHEHHRLCSRPASLLLSVTGSDIRQDSTSISNCQSPGCSSQNLQHFLHVLTRIWTHIDVVPGIMMLRLHVAYNANMCTFLSLHFLMVYMYVFYEGQLGCSSRMLAQKISCTMSSGSAWEEINRKEGSVTQDVYEAKASKDENEIRNHVLFHMCISLCCYSRLILCVNTSFFR